MSVNHFAMRAVLLVGAVLAAMPSGHAATSTASVSVSAIVSPVCQLGSSTDPAGSDRRAHGLVVTCETSVPYTLTYDDTSAPQTGSFAGSGGQLAGRVAATITY